MPTGMALVASKASTTQNYLPPAYGPLRANALFSIVLLTSLLGNAGRAVLKTGGMWRIIFLLEMAGLGPWTPGFNRDAIDMHGCGCDCLQHLYMAAHPCLRFVCAGDWCLQF